MLYFLRMSETRISSILHRQAEQLQILAAGLHRIAAIFEETIDRAMAEAQAQATDPKQTADGLHSGEPPRPVAEDARPDNSKHGS